jgi:DNA-binding MarR family transcriptional regulator
MTQTSAPVLLAEKAVTSHQKLAQEVLQRFRIVFSSVKKHFHHIEKRCGVSGAQLWAISEVSRVPGLRVSELAQAMSVHQSTASNLVADLEKKGLLKKARTEADQRIVRLFLTEKAEEVIARAPQPMIGVLPDALQNLPDDVLAQLSAGLDTLIAAMLTRDEAAATTPLSDI